MDENKIRSILDSFKNDLIQEMKNFTNPYFTIDQVVELTSLKKSYIYKLNHEGVLNPVKSNGGRVLYKRQEVFDFIEGRNIGK